MFMQHVEGLKHRNRVYVYGLEFLDYMEAQEIKRL